MTKIVLLVNTCRECPNRHYYSAGNYECLKAVGLGYLAPDCRIPSWCPLADYAPAADGVAPSCQPGTEGRDA